MSGPNELLEAVESPGIETTMELNEYINRELSEYDNRVKTLWLFILATKYYNKSEPGQFKLNDYQLAAEMVSDHE